MTKYTDVMIDLETLDVTASSVIVSIGAVRFNPEKSAIEDKGFYSIPRIQPQLRDGRTISADTLKWWFDQDDKVNHLLRIEDKVKPVLAESLHGLREYILQTDGTSTKVWGNGSIFDISILDDAYLQNSKRNPDSIPWMFWNVRDLRTLYDLSGKYEGVRKGTFHNALDDARYQAKGAIWAFENI